MWRRWLAILAVAGILVGGLWWIETTYAPLRAHYEYHQPYAGGHKNSPGDDFVRVLGIIFWSVVDAIEGHHDLWLVLETLALVGFTGTLWWSTRALWQTSIEHSDHMKGSVEAARDAANASAAQARSMEESNRISREKEARLGWNRR